MGDMTGEIQLCTLYMVKVFVGLHVSDGSFPRFHIREYNCTGLTVLHCGIGKEQWT